jgi:hypothetical protein
MPPCLSRSSCLLTCQPVLKNSSLTSNCCKLPFILPRQGPRKRHFYQQFFSRCCTRTSGTAQGTPLPLVLSLLASAVVYRSITFQWPLCSCLYRGRCSASVVYVTIIKSRDRLCGLVIRVPGYGSRYPGFDSRR